MKGMSVFCASQASTAICMSMDAPSSCSSSSSTIQLGDRVIDRYNPIIRDQRKTSNSKGIPTVPCTSQPPPINPTPYHLLHKSKKGSANNKANDQSKKSSRSSRLNDQKAKKISPNPSGDVKKSSTETREIVRKNWVNKPSDFLTPPGSSKYLPSDAAFVDVLPDCDAVLSLVPPESHKTESLIQDEPTASNPSTSSRSERPSNQVVVLRVSLHCRGCEGKVRKHLSRMEGVTSFNIDFAAKKVTIVGNLTPVSVLESVSKVKNAQFWTYATQDVDPNKSEMKKY